MNILIIDDHKLVRMGLTILVKDEIPVAEIQEAGTAAEVYKVMKDTKFEMILMDLRIPGADNLSLLQQMLLLQPDAKILVVSLNHERIYALRCLQLGARGYIEKSEAEPILRKAIRKVLEGKKYMSEAIVEQMAEYLQSGKLDNPFEVLSQRELEVATHLVNGLTSREISNTLNLQASTVSTFKSRILEKLNLKSVHDLVEMARQYDI